MITPEQMKRTQLYLRNNMYLLRKKSQMTRNRFAAKCDVTKDTIKRIESGGIPCMVTTYKLIDTLNLDVGKL